jgi:hypothetical protein
MKAIKKVIKTALLPSTSARIYIPAEEHPKDTLITGILVKTDARNINVTIQNPRTGEVYTRNREGTIGFPLLLFDDDLAQYMWPGITVGSNFINFTFPKGRGTHPWILYGLPARELEIELYSTENLGRVEIIGYYTMHDIPVLSPYVQYTTLIYVGVDARAKFVFLKPVYIQIEAPELSDNIKASVYQDGIRVSEDFKIPGDFWFSPDPAYVPEILTVETLDNIPANKTIKFHVFKLVTPSDIPTAERVPIRLGPPIPFEEGVVGREME